MKWKDFLDNFQDVNDEELGLELMFGYGASKDNFFTRVDDDKTKINSVHVSKIVKSVSDKENNWAKKNNLHVGDYFIGVNNISVKSLTKRWFLKLIEDPDLRWDSTFVVYSH